MKSFLAITGLTIKMAIRSCIFILLFIILSGLVLVLPATIIDDGTPTGHIRLSIQYCVAAITFLLTLSSIWVGAFVCSNDIENKQMHLLCTKPVSRVQIWLAKFTGVFLIHFVLLIASGAIAYTRIIYEFKKSSYSTEDKLKIESEVMVGRRVYMPEKPDIDIEIRKEYERRMTQLKELGLTQMSSQNDPFKDPKYINYQLRKQVLAKLGEVRFGPSATKLWEYKKVKKNPGKPLFLRFRPYVERITHKNQTETYGMWYFKIKINKELLANLREEAPEFAAGKPESIFIPATPAPERYAGGVFNEFPVSSAVVADNGDVTVAYENCDLERKTVYFQISDGPKILLGVCGFFENFLRAMLMAAINIAFVAALSCSLGGIFSMPTAVFICVSYILFGIFANYMISMEEIYSEGMEEKLDITKLESIHDYIGRKASIIISATTVPLQKLGVSEQLSDGEIVEFEQIASAFFKYFVLRGLPLFIFFIWFYSKRELGTAETK